MLREVWQSSRFQNASERGHLLGDLPALVIVRNCADRARARKAIGVAGIRSNFLTVVAVREVTFALPQKVYLCTSDQSAETGGERPHKMKSPQTPFLTTGLARAWESLKWWGLGFQLHLQRHRRLVGAALAAKSTGSP
jgi:hypothetical protein